MIVAAIVLYAGIASLVESIKKIINPSVADYSTTSIIILELPDTMTVDEVDLLTRRIQLKVYKKTGIILTGVGVYSYNTKNEEAAQIRNAVQKAILSHDWALQIHGFYADTAKKAIRFDVVLSFDITREEALRIMMPEVKSLYPDYDVQILPDIDLSDMDHSN